MILQVAPVSAPGDWVMFEGSIGEQQFVFRAGPGQQGQPSSSDHLGLSENLVEIQTHDS